MNKIKWEGNLITGALRIAAVVYREQATPLKPSDPMRRIADECEKLANRIEQGEFL